MRQDNHKIEQKAPEIRQLDETAQNRIAAGEVVERPASALKELVENALDAGATRIEIAIADGGKTLIRVVDDGHGISESQLPLAMSRHATSKIDGSDLVNILTFGFRGEALPSMGAVGRLTISSRQRGAASGASLSVSGGAIGSVEPKAMNEGTIVELRDLFHATPARLKFLRTDRAEMQAIVDAVKRLAMAEPAVGFVLRDVSGGGSKEVLRYSADQGALFDALATRLKSVLGADFMDNALKVEAHRDGIQLAGFASLPTYSRGNAQQQFLFVNGRPVKDKVLIGALRASYMDVLHSGRFPVVALFLDAPVQIVDVNVHPAKSEVRFKDPGIVRGLIISAIKHALAEGGHRTSSTISGATLGAFTPEQPSARIYQMEDRIQPMRPTHQRGFAETQDVFSGRVESHDEIAPTDAPLGAARAQLHENYIIAQTDEGMVIIDQHAAHERLVYEKLKTQIAENGVVRQALLIPEIVELSEQDCATLLDAADTFAQFGLIVESFGKNAIAVQEVPAVLGEVNATEMLKDILDELSEHNTSTEIQTRIEVILSRVACHGSIRSGRRMRAEEMNALLREMEATPNSGQCNHGRPTYVKLALKDIEKLFGRR